MHLETDINADFQSHLGLKIPRFNEQRSSEMRCTVHVHMITIAYNK